MLFTSDSQGIKAWNVARDGKLSEEFQYNGHVPSLAGAVTALVVSDNGKIAASLGRDGTLKIWSATDGREVASYSTGLSAHFVVCCWISADGREVKVSDVRKLVTCRPATGDSPITVELPRGIPRGVAFSANGKLLAITGTSGVVLCNGDDGRQIATLTGSRGIDSHLTFAANGRLLLNQCSSGLRVWRLSDQKLLETYVPSGRLSLICTAADELACGWLEQEGSTSFLHLRALSLHRSALAVVAKAQTSSARRRSLRSRGKWRVNDKAEMQSGSRWKPVTIIAVNDDGTVRIHWDGWSNTWDEDVTPDRIREPGGEQ
jgi:WD40 repeat protein